MKMIENVKCTCIKTKKKEDKGLVMNRGFFFWGLVIIDPIIELEKLKDNLTCCEITSFLFYIIKIMFNILK